MEGKSRAIYVSSSWGGTLLVEDFKSFIGKNVLAIFF
jgi:hypothetical protein